MDQYGPKATSSSLLRCESRIASHHPVETLRPLVPSPEHPESGSQCQEPDGEELITQEHHIAAAAHHTTEHIVPEHDVLEQSALADDTVVHHTSEPQAPHVAPQTKKFDSGDNEDGNNNATSVRNIVPHVNAVLSRRQELHINTSNADHATGNQFHEQASVERPSGIHAHANIILGNGSENTGQEHDTLEDDNCHSDQMAHRSPSPGGHIVADDLEHHDIREARQTDRPGVHPSEEDANAPISSLHTDHVERETHSHLDQQTERDQHSVVLSPAYNEQDADGHQVHHHHDEQQHIDPVQFQPPEQGTISANQPHSQFHAISEQGHRSEIEHDDYDAEHCVGNAAPTSSCLTERDSHDDTQPTSTDHAVRTHQDVPYRGDDEHSRHATRLRGEVCASAPEQVPEIEQAQDGTDGHNATNNDSSHLESKTPASCMSVDDDMVRRGSERYHASSDQLRCLLHEFKSDPTPSVEKLNNLCYETGMPLPNIVLWFKNRRARHRKNNPALPKTRRRSYVKSGIYSRNRSKLVGASTKSNDEKTSSPSTPNSGVLHSRVRETSSVVTIGADAGPCPLTHEQAISTAKGNNEHVEHGKRELEEAFIHEVHEGAVKRTRYAGVEELFGRGNPCHSWDGEKCHVECMTFFSKVIGDDHPEQIAAARAVSSTFFLSELQNGLTLTSAMQPLELSVNVLDDIIEQLSNSGPSLSSGSQVVLREFLAQVRSGQAGK